MYRRLKANTRDAFARSADEHAQDVVRLLQHRRAVMDATWQELEEGWKTHNERMVTFGLTPRTFEEGMIKLSVGGSNVNVSWHLLAETEGFQESVLGALLEGVWGEGRIPRDADGRIVIDESPASIKHIIHAMLGRASSTGAVGLPEIGAHSTVAMDEVPCLLYTAQVMGLPGYVPAYPRYVKLNGDSAILEPFEIAPFRAKIREWVGGPTDEEMTLIYRATRDGFDTKSFKSRCNGDIPHTISVIRVSSDQENDSDSVVGGYSNQAWGSGVASKQTITEETFAFMLKDGSATRKRSSKPVKWGPYPECVGKEFSLNESAGACVGGNDLITVLDATTQGCTLQTGRKTFDIEEDSPFLALHGKDVVDIEVYRYSTPAPSTTTAPKTADPDGEVLTDAETHDMRSLGEIITSSLIEERVVLGRAVKEVETAEARVSAAACALLAVYGPSVAAGEQDAVVELNVHGTRMTTLLSTLQACPQSALATMFNEDRWPATDKDKDGHGRRLIDCSPPCFSKILDVLRMRKRASWSRGVEGGTQGKENSSSVLPGGVHIKFADVEAFVAAVNMYFPGCESFIIDLMQTV